MFGVRQSGEFSFALGDIYSDAGILKAASEAVDKLFEEDYELEKEEHLSIKKHFMEDKIGNSVDFRTI